MSGDTASTIGDILRAKRESRGLTVKQVYEATKITVENITALEENRFDAFPNKVYARAFLRDYSNFLGLDSSSLLAKYESEWQSAAEAEVSSAPLEKTLRKNLLGVLLVAVVVCGAILGWHSWWSSSDEKSYLRSVRPANLPTTKQSVSTSKTTPSPSSSVSSVVPTAPTSTQQVPAAKTSEPAEGLVLEVTALKEVWVRVKSEGVRVYEAIMPAGAAKTCSALEFI
ncbi:MAG: helix-turn-helix domain-containing protein, partial [Armatimonadota bacterium]